MADSKKLGVDGGSYACPLTGVVLECDGLKLRAGAEGPVYEVCNGVPRFLRFQEAESDATKANLARLNRIAVDRGWREAIEEIFADSPQQIQYNTDPERLKILDLLPSADCGAVLEIGSALGHFTVELARRAETVHALEIVPGQAEFTAERCRQEGLRNVSVACGGDDCRLPYASASFDVVVCNLVLEWCSGRMVDEPFVDGQRRLLAEIHRVLKPGGRAILTTKNRFALHYVVGKADEHVYDMRFGNALPRWLTAALLKRRGKKRVGGLLHSHNQLRGMLREAGFEDPRSYWAAPEMRFPRHLVPTDAASIRAIRRDPNFVAGFSRTTKALTPLIPAPLVKHFTPGLLFVVRKSD